MDAIISRDFGDASVEEIPRPSPDADEVLIEVDRVQLSVTECLLFDGQESAFYETVRHRMHDGDGRLFGHEFCGTVVDVGADVDEFQEGDRVYPPGKISCGDCAYCTSGYKHLCENKGTIGLHTPGALAEYVVLPPEPLCKLPGAVSDGEGAALQPFASAVVCVHEADISTGDTVAVVGSGVMGAQCGQLALRHGASEVYAIDVDPEKVDIAEELGMVGINAEDNDPVERVRDATGGIGADVVFEAVGGAQETSTEGTEPLAQAYQLTRRGGQVVQVGIITTEMTFHPRSWRGKVVDWVNPNDMAGVLSTGPNSDTGARAADLVASGRVSIDQFVTHQLSGLDSFAEAVEITLNKEAYDALGPAQIVV